MTPITTNSSNLTSTHELSYDVSIIIPQVFIAVVMVVTIVYSGLIISTFLYERSLRTPFNVYILNLALVDLGIACVQMPLFIPYTVFAHRLVSPGFCTFYLYVSKILPAAALAAVVLIAMDRVMALYYPIVYREWRSVKSSLATCVLMWTWLHATIVPYLGYARQIANWQLNANSCYPNDQFLHRYQLALQIVLFELPILFVLVSYVLLMARATTRYKRALHRVRPQHRSVNGERHVTINTVSQGVAVGGSANTNSTTTANEGRMGAVAEKTERAFYSALVGIAGLLIVLWTPAGVYFFLTALHGNYSNFTMYIVVLCLEYCSCAINPFVYHRNLPDIRRAMRRVLGRARRQEPTLQKRLR